MTAAASVLAAGRSSLFRNPIPVRQPRSATWTLVQPGLHVATWQGRTLGSVTTTATRNFVAFDDASTPVGLYRTIEEAQHWATTPATDSRKRRPSSSRSEGGFITATVVGSVAGSLLLAAALTFIR